MLLLDYVTIIDYVLNLLYYLSIKRNTILLYFLKNLYYKILIIINIINQKYFLKTFC